MLTVPSMLLIAQLMSNLRDEPIRLVSPSLS